MLGLIARVLEDVEKTAQWNAERETGYWKSPPDSPGSSRSPQSPDGVVYHTYSAYERGIDILWGMYQWLDRAARGANETGPWWRRHDEYHNQ